MKLLLVGFKLTIGIEQYLESILNSLKQKKIKVKAIGDTHTMKKLDEITLTNGSSPFRMILDTLNPIIWIRFLIHQKNFNADFIIFVSSHSLNFIAIFFLRLFFSCKIISVIHDPIPHSGSKFPKIILVSQYLQAYQSHYVVVAGEYLKKSVLNLYPIKKSQVIILPIGNNRKKFPKQATKSKREYFSILGRIEDYKGIDIFLRSGLKFLKDKRFEESRFLIAGKGDLSKYDHLIKQYQTKNLEIFNYEISDEAFDNIIRKSFAVVLPYKDATQTCTIQIANSLSTPCIVTKAGCLPELVVSEKTGEIIDINSSDQLKNVFIKLSSDINYLETLEKNAYEFSKNNLQWNYIIDNFLKTLEAF